MASMIPSSYQNPYIYDGVRPSLVSSRIATIIVNTLSGIREKVFRELRNYFRGPEEVDYAKVEMEITHLEDTYIRSGYTNGGQIAFSIDLERLRLNKIASLPNSYKESETKNLGKGTNLETNKNQKLLLLL